MKILINILFFFLYAITAYAVVDSEGGYASPDCKLAESDSSKTWDLSQFKGQVIYIDFWASWCPPCLKSFPFMNELHTHYKSKDFKVIAVNLDEEQQQAEGFLAKQPVEFTVAYDNANRDCATAFNLKAMPSSYLIDKKGKVRHVHVGFKSSETQELRNLVELLLAE